MSSLKENPYSAPEADPRLADEISERDLVYEPWKAIARRWERLRIVYNLLMFVAGMLSLVLIGLGPAGPLGTLLGVVLYAIAANICYTFGPIAEMYVNWFVDDCEDTLIPRPMARLVRSKLVTALLWGGGTLFSLFVTSLPGLAILLAPDFG